MKEKYCRVIESYQTPFPNPIKISKGEILNIGKKESEWSGWIWCINGVGEMGWVPESYLEIYETNCKVLQDYDATELSVDVGQELIIKKEEAGWIWATNQQGKSGWVPLKNVQMI